MIKFNKKRTFGVEIETISPTGSIYETAKLLHDNGFKVNNPDDDEEHVGYDYEDNEDREAHAPLSSGYWTDERWTVKPDGSLNDCGVEITTPILRGEAGLKELEKACKLLVAHRFEADLSCGLHVHHGADDLTRDDAARLLQLYSKYEPLIDNCLHKSRVHNDYCRPLPPADKVLEALGVGESYFGGHRRSTLLSDRYYKVNLVAFAQHGTVEFRQHHGTVDPNRITSWVLFTHAFMERAKHPLTYTPVDLSNNALGKLKRELKMDDKLLKDAVNTIGTSFKERTKEAVKGMLVKQPYGGRLLSLVPRTAQVLCAGLDGKHCVDSRGLPIHTDGTPCLFHMFSETPSGRGCWEHVPCRVVEPRLLLDFTGYVFNVHITNYGRCSHAPTSTTIDLTQIPLETFFNNDNCPCRTGDDD